VENGQEFNVMVQASAPQAASVLQAEADAMLLATKLAELLNINIPTLLTDNQILAKAMASRKLDNPQLHWNARETFAQILNSMFKTKSQVFHIKRDLNGAAHKCANQVLRQSLGEPIYRCICSAHSSSSCHAISSLQNVSWQDYVIQAVLCT
jgi:ribonuclease HI